MSTSGPKASYPRVDQTSSEDRPSLSLSRSPELSEEQRQSNRGTKGLIKKKKEGKKEKEEKEGLVLGCSWSQGRLLGCQATNRTLTYPIGFGAAAQRVHYRVAAHVVMDTACIPITGNHLLRYGLAWRGGRF